MAFFFREALLTKLLLPPPAPVRQLCVAEAVQLVFLRFSERPLLAELTLSDEECWLVTLGRDVTFRATLSPPSVISVYSSVTVQLAAAGTVVVRVLCTGVELKTGPNGSLEACAL